MLTITPYTPANFLTPIGAWKRANQLEKKGFPTDLKGWRFITLSIDRGQIPDPLDAYNSGKRHLREFIYQLRQVYDIKRWCWKLEFHKPDLEGNIFPHWHLLLDYKQKINCDTLTRLWGRGRTDIKRVNDQGFRYLFKYVSKDISDLPTWVLNAHQVRFFQTSVGFFSDNEGALKKDALPSPRHGGMDQATETQNEVSKLTIGERLQKWSRTFVVRNHLPHGHATYAKQNANASWGLFRLQLCQAKFEEKIPQNVMQITSNKIVITCPRILAFPQISSLSVAPLATSRCAPASARKAKHGRSCKAA